MFSSSVRFAGLKDFVVPNEAGKAQVPHVKKVFALKPDALKAKEECAQGLKVQFQDDSFAYVHPYHANLHNRIGAHKLAKLLQFDISPKVKAIAIPEELSHDKPRPTSPFGTVVDWIKGLTFKKFSGVSSPHRKKFDYKNLAELYLFFLISQDSDFHNRNIIVKIPTEHDKPVKLFAIDNEKTGAPLDDFMEKLNKYPDELRKRVEGKPIPQEVLAKLQHFVDHRATGAEKLDIYYPSTYVENCYKIAQHLLETRKIPKQNEIREFLTTLKPAEVHPLPVVNVIVPVSEKKPPVVGTMTESEDQHDPLPFATVIDDKYDPLLPFATVLDDPLPPYKAVDPIKEHDQPPAYKPTDSLNQNVQSDDSPP